MRKLLPSFRRRWLVGSLTLLALFAAASLLPAAPRVEADPNKTYPITPEAGQFVICAASYTGPNAASLAHQMVYHLRQRDNLPAYYYDRGAKERQEQEEQLNKVRQFSDPGARIRKVRIEDQFAVLIGGFPDRDSARHSLDGIKKLKPPELKLGPNITTTAHTINPQTGQRLEISPFVSAFVSANPLLAQAQPAQEKGDDPFLKELNAGEEYSLLQNKKPFTLAVKEYHGISVTQPRSSASMLLDKVGLGKKSTDTLSASGLQAHELCKLLRGNGLGLEAYVLHTRRSSVVCVGGFSSPEDPELYRVQQRLARLSFQSKEGRPSNAVGADVLQLFSPAIPMRVPRP